MQMQLPEDAHSCCRGQRASPTAVVKPLHKGDKAISLHHRALRNSLSRQSGVHNDLCCAKKDSTDYLHLKEWGDFEAA